MAQFVTLETVVVNTVPFVKAIGFVGAVGDVGCVGGVVVGGTSPDDSHERYGESAPPVVLGLRAK
jgi:hypothetical protein